METSTQFKTTKPILPSGSNGVLLDNMKLKLQNQNFFAMPAMVIGMLFCFLPIHTFASDFSSIENKTSTTLEKVFLEAGPGLDFTMVGGSLLVDQTIQKISKTRLKISSPVRKAFLIWSGEVKEQNKNAGKIRFLGPKSQEHPIITQHLWKRNSTGILYSALADVTQYVTGSGMYGVKNLSSDKINPGGKDPYSVAGWALVVVTEDRNTKKSSSVAFLAGLQVLKPGEIYDIPLTPYLTKDFVEADAIGIIGGHGRAGNGSGNLLNGLAISGQDDWDGSAGKFWDVDLFKPYPHTKYVAEKEDLTLTVDPLLQWIYPIGVIIKSWSTE
jgi:hypothetical protein